MTPWTAHDLDPPSAAGVRSAGDGDQHGPSWSPDGKQVAYSRQLGDKWAVVRSSVGGGPDTVIIPGVYSGTTEWVRSADGELIGFSTGQGVQVVSPEGKNRRCDEIRLGFRRWIDPLRCSSRLGPLGAGDH
jgi:Tol biopolymer transport system component